VNARCWRNEYRMRDGARLIGPPHFTRWEAVRAGAEVQGMTGALVLFRWRVVARLPATFSEAR
jgi:hypothetical protein